MNLNKATLIGRVTKDPDIKDVNGTKISNFSLATNNIYKDKNGEKKETAEFHNIVLFGKLAELSGQYVKKGNLLMIGGRISYSNWEKDGKTYYRTDIIGEEMQFGPKNKKEEEPNEIPT